MKFGTIISVHDSRQRTHQKIHEKHEIPAFPAPKRNEIWTPPDYLQPRTCELAKSMQNDMNF